MHRCLEPMDHRGRWRILALAPLLAWAASLSACGQDDDDCDDPTLDPNGACSREGAVCQWADDCGGQTLECQDGLWVTTDATGCFAEPIACAEGAAELDSCDGDPPCDPDGDCRDVLECVGYTWLAYDVCSEEYCPAAAPQEGKACDSEERSCTDEHRCGNRTFQCVDGWWHFIGGAICTDPVACAEVPVENDACDTAGEVCEPLVEDLPTLACDGSTWDRQ
jgi:hypothetical protein